MIQWYWALIAFVVGEVMGFITIIICMDGGIREQDERDWAEEQGLLYREDKKGR